MLKNTSPDLLWAGAYGKNQENRGWPFLTSPLAPVNPSDFLFHLLPLAGLLMAGGWGDRLVIWCPLLDQAARLLLVVEGGRR